MAFYLDFSAEEDYYTIMVVFDVCFLKHFNDLKIFFGVPIKLNQTALKCINPIGVGILDRNAL